jgi:hypothetical protein
MPRYSATTIVWAPANCADTSATTAFLVVKIETHRSFLLSSPHATGKSRRTHGDLDQEQAIRCRVA